MIVPPWIALVGVARRPGARALRDAVAAAAEGLRFAYLPLDDIDVDAGVARGLVLRAGGWTERALPLPSAFSLLGPPREPRHRETVLALRRRMPCAFHFPGPKDRQIEALRQTGLFDGVLPETRRLRSPRDLEDLLERHGDVVLKPAGGNKGRGVFRVTAGPTLHSPTGARPLSAEAICQAVGERPYVVQQTIDSTLDGAPFDVRLHVLKGGEGAWRLGAVYGRVGAPGQLTSNLHTGGGFYPGRDLLAERFGEQAEAVWLRLSTLAGALPPAIEHVMGRPLAELGLDLGLDPAGQPWLFEINAGPGHGFLSLDLARDGVRCLDALARQKTAPRRGTPVATPHRPLVAVIGAARRPDGERIYRAAAWARVLDVDLAYCPARGIDASGRRLEAFRYDDGRWVAETCRWPAAVLNLARGEAVSELLARVPHALVDNGPKDAVLDRFAPADVALHVRRLSGVEDLQALLERAPAVIVKPREGEGGRGVCRVTRDGGGLRVTADDPDVPDSAEALCDGTRLAQVELPSRTAADRPVDVRLHVVRGPTGWVPIEALARVGQVGRVGTAGRRGLFPLKPYLAAWRPQHAAALSERFDALAASLPEAYERLYPTVSAELAFDFGVDPDGRLGLFEVDCRPEPAFVSLAGDRLVIEHLVRLARGAEGC